MRKIEQLKATLGADIRAALEPTVEMIEAGCRGMYGKHWDGPPEKMPGNEMKEVWRGYARKCLVAALAPAVDTGQEMVPKQTKGREDQP